MGFRQRYLDRKIKTPYKKDGCELDATGLSNGLYLKHNPGLIRFGIREFVKVHSQFDKHRIPIHKSGLFQVYALAAANLSNLFRFATH
jgi:hypothetical protein